ncbi:family 10 glycosylhydrolase [Hymenobacter psychrotolerans]|uniref:Por secretion system C-terminal sorting domain-containing protein n=1 Tax=Hymenobacter psychrotolerans DSM 18569 TaxID=1121959 RepID=A0A1M6QA63_9BACT|nr:family 10 glycosylhydrolase [Hymenobacter psychrotolerans]SHK17132.1 Por secretion system C-terminal sorting domain-containing protein [Hymenobacter psychrotolerans DSM 18569]
MLLRYLRWLRPGLYAALFLIINALPSQAQPSSPPKRELRAAWVAHVFNLDWPSARTRTPAQQRQEFVGILDSHRQNGMNAVVVQIRAAADALYPSTLEPWSEWLTGTQGVGPNPPYDPLAFMVREAHRRELEFHAWLNPYRALTNATTASVAPTHVTVQHPDWVVPFGTLRVLNPGLPAVRQYLTRVVMDVVRRYDVDAIHFDDYFYPAPQTGVVFNDDAAFAADPRGFAATTAGRANWRRNNVDIFVKMVSDSIRSVKPWVKFGISPPGVWRNGTSVGGTATTAFQSYSDIFADSRKWLRRGWVDYLAPQVYFAIGQTAANYSLIVPWWSQQVNPDTVRHVYIGQGVYRISATATEPGFRSPSQLPSQIRLLRQQPNVQGSMFYKTTELRANPLGLADSLRQDFYRYPALLPTMPWKDNVPPTAPVQAGLWNNSNSGFVEMSWQPGPAATDGQLARQYVVYRVPAGSGPITAADLANPANIRAITDTTYFREPATGTSFRYALTALDRLHNESATATLTILLPTTAGAQAAPLLEPAYPNPFQAETRLAFTLPTAGPAEMRLLDLTGREVALLASGRHAAGRHELTLRAAALPAGLYVLVLRTTDGVARQRLLLTR